MDRLEMETPKYPRYSLESRTCVGIHGHGFIDIFFNRFHDSFLFSFVLQFLLVTLMFTNVGKGIYWKVLFYSSLAGLFASILENSAIAHACMPASQDVARPFSLWLFLFDEIFWILSEYSIPYLNLIKMKAFASGKLAKIMRYTIMGLFVPFVLFRILIGYNRMKKGIIEDVDIKTYHGYAFAVMAVADLICTFGILYFVRKNNNHVTANSNLNEYIKHSSYTILVTVDIASSLLAIIDIITSLSKNDLYILSSLAVPLQCLKSSFALVLAIDAFLFKYGANVTSINESSGNNSKYTGYGNNSSSNTFNYSNYNKSINFNKSKSNYSIDMNISNNKKSNQSNIISPYNYPSIEKDSYTSKLEVHPYQNKSIVKNYTNIQTKSIFSEASNQYDSEMFSSTKFGFLNSQSQKY